MLSCDAGEFGAKEGGGRRWLIGDYDAGDAVFHHACECNYQAVCMSVDVNAIDTIHASGTNQDPENRIRLSADLRFADRAAPHETRWAQ